MFITPFPTLFYSKLWSGVGDALSYKIRSIYLSTLIKKEKTLSFGLLDLPLSDSQISLSSPRVSSNFPSRSLLRPESSWLLLFLLLLFCISHRLGFRFQQLGFRFGDKWLFLSLVWLVLNLSICVCVYVSGYLIDSSLCVLVLSVSLSLCRRTAYQQSIVALSVHNNCV